MLKVELNIKPTHVMLAGAGVLMALVVQETGETLREKAKHDAKKPTASSARLGQALKDRSSEVSTQSRRGSRFNRPDSLDRDDD